MTFRQSARVQKDIIFRDTFAQLESQRNLLKSISLDQTLPYTIRTAAASDLCLLGSTGARTLVKNRCVITGRSKGVNKRFRLSRIMLRKMTSEGVLPSIQKISW